MSEISINIVFNLTDIVLNITEPSQYFLLVVITVLMVGSICIYEFHYQIYITSSSNEDNVYDMSISVGKVRY